MSAHEIVRPFMSGANTRLAGRVSATARPSSRPGFPRVAGLLAYLLACTCARTASADWHVGGVPVCIAPRDQTKVQCVGDGAGGAFVIWRDERQGGNLLTGIYAQHVLPSGAMDPAWAQNGVAVCSTGGVDGLVAMPDGSGGAIVAWEGFSSPDPNIFAHHLTASGIDPGWPANGLTVVNAPSTQELPEIVSDGSGGAIVTWDDLRSGNFDVYAQHVMANGSVDPNWPSNGRRLCTASGNQMSPQLSADGAGGAIVAWDDDRGDGTTPHIYGQHVLASGGLDAAWPATGLALCTAPNGQYIDGAFSDGTGGATVFWEDLRNSGVNGYDIYAQHVLGTGSIAPGWPADGAAICAAVGDQQVPVAALDGTGGTIVAWADSRTTANSYDIYAQHVIGSGMDPAWTFNGSLLCSAPNQQYVPSIATDMAGGAIVAWEDSRNPSVDIYAQRVLASGAVDGDWPLNGDPVCTEPHDQSAPAIASDGAGGAIVAWSDTRNGLGADIYAQRVYAGGGVASVGPARSRGLWLAPPSPNPARGTIGISLDLPQPARVSVEVFDLAGQRVRSLASDRSAPAGTLNLIWDGRSDEGAQVPSGLYFIRAEAGARSLTRKLAIVR